MANRDVRISIADLVWDAVNLNTGEVARIGILSQKALEHGKRVWAALGGAAILSPAGMQYMIDSYDAHSFETDATSGHIDLRCVIEERHLETVFEAFKTYRTDLEHMHCHDIMHELKALGLFTSSALGRLMLQYQETRPQMNGASIVDGMKFKLGVQTYRLFRIYDLLMPGELFERLTKQKYVRSLTMDEVATTNGGAVRGVANNGDEIQNNFF
jgi:hypothetical protein